MSLRLASASPRSMRRASETSCSAVSSETLPISRKYMRTGSLLGDLTERSSLAPGSSSVAGSALGRRAASPLDDVDVEVGEDGVDLLDLLGREFEIVQRRCDVGAVEVAVRLALVDERADLVCLEQREIDRRRSPLGAAVGGAAFGGPAARRGVAAVVGAAAMCAGVSQAASPAFRVRVGPRS